MRHTELWPHFSDGNRLTLLETGAAFFPALEREIDAARVEIFLETYIFKYDAVGTRLVAGLRRAAARGVAVRLLVDGFGSRHFVEHHRKDLLEAGIQLLVYRRELSRWSLRRHRLRRLHRKLAVIDGRVAFVGGINLASDIPDHIPDHPRHDYALKVEGPLLRAIHSSVRHVWELVAWASLKQRFRLDDIAPPQGRHVGDITAAFVIRDNIRHRRDIENAYLDAVDQARRQILIANAYFLPGRRFRRALVAAAERGVEVTILLQGQVEYRIQHYATQALYPSLMHHGIRIFEYRRSFLHAKVAVIDDVWATVGSSNIDPFSLLLAREANVIARDRGFAEQLRTRVEHAMAEGARPLSLTHWRKKPLLTRMLRWLAYGVARLAVGISGYGKGKEGL
ncbi:cardiolipin synthase ClsB [Nitrogeniibacter mangrovi]|uniref:Cardiolipin synthase B n=1 Tax=Nitrogeniibacter mangrovi TaxID=2016596 RepID=A0A6C1B581_9RHOO|nr:cardiolipin synthase ClsB [Nitrogeniibacter mangrovi]QID18876.1 cardiolipin synthase ClsB [Nitrogeniibacter mangrovi]